MINFQHQISEFTDKYTTKSIYSPNLNVTALPLEEKEGEELTFAGEGPGKPACLC